jgi:hypothetical protein
MLGVYFFALPPIFRAGCVLPAPSTVHVLLQLTVFQFSRAVQFWMLQSGSGDRPYDPLLALLWVVAYHPPTLSIQCVCLLIVHADIRSLPIPISPVHFHV